MPRIRAKFNKKAQNIMSAENPERQDDNVVYIDEHNRERWLLKLRIARESGQIAVFGAIRDKPADIIPFPKPYIDDDPDGAA